MQDQLVPFLCPSGPTWFPGLSQFNANDQRPFPALGAIGQVAIVFSTDWRLVLFGNVTFLNISGTVAIDFN